MTDEIAMSDLGLNERPRSINDWIEDELHKGFNGYQLMPEVEERIREIAQGAALHIIADKAALIDNLANEVHANNVRAGWWNDLKTGEDLHGRRNIGELLCLVHSEVSEAAEKIDSAEQIIFGLRMAINEAWMNERDRKARLLDLHKSLSAAMEGHRKALMDDKLPHRPGFRVELVDAVIRLLDILGSDNREHSAGTIFAEKTAFNANRADHKPENRAQAGGKAY